MTFTKSKFKSDRDNEFFILLRKRVKQYFETNELSRFGNTNMVIKTIFMFLLYLTPYFFLISGISSSPAFVIFMYALMGLGSAGLGLNVMHDANHGAYSKKRWINKLLGYSMDLIGSSAELWKIQHNVLHHTYTNVHGADEDIDTPAIIRLSPYSKRYWIHKYQFLYVWFFYGISTLSWVLFKDFRQIIKYKRTGLIKGRKNFNKILTQLILWKLIYIGYVVAIPAIVLPVSFWLILLSFVIMHFITGMVLSLIFQTAHVMPDCEFTIPDEKGIIEKNWAVHEILTTSNYAPSSRVFSWLIGGLNYQIEHHLFSNICHVHYKKISSIVASTAKEFGLPYHVQKNFLIALRDHTKMLYKLGRMEPVIAK